MRRTLGTVVAVLVPSTGPIRRLTQRSGGDASDTDGQAAGRVSGSGRVKRLYNIDRRDPRNPRFKISSPLFEREARDMAKFFGVRSNERQIDYERVAGNQQIIRADRRSCRLQFKTQCAGAARGIGVE